MDRRFVLAFTATLALGGCAVDAGSGWITLIDGDKGLDNFDRVGDANWRGEGGLIVADKGNPGFLITKSSYKDFAIRAEFWAETDTNSGIFFRLSDPKNITATNSYEANIWDIVPDLKYASGAIVNFAAVDVPSKNKVGGRWNTLVVEAKGSRITVWLNGVQTVALDNDKYGSGPIALQYGRGVQGAVSGPIKWRKVQVKPL